ncbi:MAG: hypothetical protein ACK4NW_03680 [Roseinatronobacter sp.]
MKPVVLLMALALLAACGAEAPPRAPEPVSVSVSGEVTIGVSGRL